jgi:hypothetical protein
MSEELHRKFGDLDLKALSEAPEIDLHIIVPRISDLVECVKDVVPFDRARSRRLVLIGKRVVVVQMERRDILSERADDVRNGRIRVNIS